MFICEMLIQLLMLICLCLFEPYSYLLVFLKTRNTKIDETNIMREDKVEKR